MKMVTTIFGWLNPIFQQQQLNLLLLFFVALFCASGLRYLRQIGPF